MGKTKFQKLMEKRKDENVTRELLNWKTRFIENNVRTKAFEKKTVTVGQEDLLFFLRLLGFSPTSEATVRFEGGSIIPFKTCSRIVVIWEETKP